MNSIGPAGSTAIRGLALRLLLPVLTRTGLGMSFFSRYSFVPGKILCHGISSGAFSDCPMTNTLREPMSLCWNNSSSCSSLTVSLYSRPDRIMSRISYVISTTYGSRTVCPTPITNYTRRCGMLALRCFVWISWVILNRCWQHSVFRLARLPTLLTASPDTSPYSHDPHSPTLLLRRPPLGGGGMESPWPTIADPAFTLTPSPVERILYSDLRLDQQSDCQDTKWYRHLHCSLGSEPRCLVTLGPAAGPIAS